MSSGSHAPRKPNVAAAAPTTSLFKASSRFLHSGGRSGPAAGTGGSGRGVKRQRAAAVAPASALDSTESNTNIVEVSRCFAVGGEHADSPGGVKSKKRFVGVRQRPSGRWVAEIKDTTQKIRLWLGTFDSAEEGAKAYDNAARALRGANTRTNFLPVMASCEGTLPPSKAARQIQLRQIAAASKACEKEAARNNVADDQPSGEEESLPANTLPLVRQNLQQSISSLDSPAIEDDRTTTSFLPSPKPARLMGRRHSAPLASAKPEQVEDIAFQNYDSVIDAGPKSKLEVVTPSPLKLEPQQSVTSENLSNAISHSLTAGSEQESSSSPGAFRLASPRSPFECIEPTTTTTSVANGAVHSVTNTFVEAMESHLSSFNQERFTTHRLESLAFPMENFVAPPPIPFHDMTASGTTSTRQSLYLHHSCGTNRDMYASEKDQDVICCRHQGFGSSNQPINSNDIDDDDDDAMHVDDGDHNCVEREARVVKEESSVEYARSERCFLREGEFVLPEPGVQELELPDSPWPDYGLMDELEMDSSALLGLDLRNESSGVYKSPFDFSAEAIDRDSCTSGELLEEHASTYFRVPYEQPQSPPGSEDLQECVLLTEPPALYYSLSSPAPGSPPLSPWETTSSSLHWRMDNDTTTTTSTWDGHSSGSTTDIKPQPNGDASGECISSQDHEALWSSMDLPPLCMVA